MTIVENAHAFAADRHRTQRRKYSDAPYTVHLEAVVAILRDHGVEDEHTLAAAYLHDTVEDTQTTIQELIGVFGDRIAELVYWLTDAENGNRATRMAMASWRLGRAPWEAKLVKLADIIDNTRNISENDPSFAPAFLAEKREVLDRMLESEGVRLAALPLFQVAAKSARKTEDDVEAIQAAGK
jgi:GTP diphosphokinase / guanosine-3',5'-bis(diphosphate) 3'-diphosphatase